MRYRAALLLSALAAVVAACERNPVATGVAAGDEPGRMEAATGYECPNLKIQYAYIPGSLNPPGHTVVVGNARYPLNFVSIREISATGLEKGMYRINPLGGPYMSKDGAIAVAGGDVTGWCYYRKVADGMISTYGWTGQLGVTSFDGNVFDPNAGGCDNDNSLDLFLDDGAGSMTGDASCTGDGSGSGGDDPGNIVIENPPEAPPESYFPPSPQDPGGSFWVDDPCDVNADDPLCSPDFALAARVSGDGADTSRSSPTSASHRKFAARAYHLVTVRDWPDSAVIAIVGRFRLRRKAGMTSEANAVYVPEGGSPYAWMLAVRTLRELQHKHANDQVQRAVVRLYADGFRAEYNDANRVGVWLRSWRRNGHTHIAPADWQTIRSAFETHEATLGSTEPVAGRRLGAIKVMIVGR